MEDLISPRQAAAIAGVDVTTVWRWAKAGQIRAARFGDGRRRAYSVSSEDVRRVAHERASRLAAQALAIQAGMR